MLKKTRLQSGLFSFLALISMGKCTWAQLQMPSSSPKLTVATCGEPICTWNAFGPVTYTRDTGQPQTVGNDFSVLNPNTQFTLHIDNNGVSSAVVSVNGVQIVGPSDFNPNLTRLDRTITLALNNAVQVQLRGDPGASLSVTIIGVDNGPPSILESEAPPANAFGWNNTNVSVSFACSDAISGVASCPNPVVLTTEGLNQVVAGTAFDLAGNSETASVQISIDKTPPTILPSQNPPANAFGWNNAPVTVTFLCNDSLSGVQTCTPPVLLSTQGQNQTVMGMAMDFAGNSAMASTSVSIDLTPPAIVATASPAANASGWNNTPVTVSFSCTDALSGVASCPPPQIVSAEGSGQNINGTAFDKAGNGASATVTLNIDETPPVVSVSSPANDVAVSSANLQITGTASDNLSGVAAVSCNGSSGSISGSSFTCSITLVPGSNSIQVQAVDLAGNVASTQLSVTFNAVPPKAIFITPMQVSLLVGQNRTVSLAGDIGQVVTGAGWAISDPTVVSITTDDPPQLTAMAEGTTTLTANFSGLSASMTINVLGGTALPVGTPIWSLNPLPGNVTIQMLKGNPINPGDPDIFALESPGTLRGLTADGRQLWIAQVERPAQTAASTQTGTASATAQRSVAAAPAPTVQARALPDNLMRKIRAQLGSDPLQQFLERHPQLTRKMQFISLAAKTLNAQAQAAGATLSETDFVTGSVPDNNGGTVNSIFRDMSAFPFFETTLVRIDNATQQISWSYDSPGLITGMAIAPDNTVYATEVFLTATSFPLPSDIGSLSLFDSSTLLADPETELAGLASAALDPNATWAVRNGNLWLQRAPTPFQITKVARNRALVGSTTNLFVRGTGFGQSPQLIFGDPSKPDNDLTVSNFLYDESTGVITADIKVAPDAVGGKVPIFVKSGAKTTKPNNSAFFFVQIPTSLQRADFPGAPGGTGPLQVVTDGSIVELDGTVLATHQCGVYRNYTFQLMDQDTPPQPIQQEYSITENLTYSPACSQAQVSAGVCPSQVTASSNSTGIIADTQSISLPTPSCLSPGTTLTVTQGFSVPIDIKTFFLTTVVQIQKGNFAGTLEVDSTFLHP